MLAFAALVALLWSAAHLLGWKASARWGLVLALYGVVVAITLVLPAGHGLRVMFGNTPAPWLLLGAAMGFWLVYRQGLRWLRGRATAQAAAWAQSTPPLMPSDDASALGDAELARYARHIVLRELGGMGQKRLKAARVLVVGAGGLGSPSLLYLAAAGVGTLSVIDEDSVAVSNLHRQVIHSDGDIGRLKVHSAAEKMVALNPHVRVHAFKGRLDSRNAATLIAEHDAVLDGCDNFPTRYLVNRICTKQGKPLISGALSQWEGQISVFDPAQGGPCYACVFPRAPARDLAPPCAEAGVIGPLPGVVGAMMATEALKLLADCGHTLRGRMLIYNALEAQTREIILHRRKDCPVCSPPEHTEAMANGSQQR
ncbi:MAG: molybdopterin-synthase adenylyltransferase MoeB [Rhodobacteraceae bacterium]|nr:molybdopterin-synthase adenylyltransferase MoeB [Paracoccaceae bacterium]